MRSITELTMIKNIRRIKISTSGPDFQFDEHPGLKLIHTTRIDLILVR